MNDVVIGIDLGTTNSCVSLYLNGKTRILENSDGDRITRSFIFFTDLKDTIIGNHGRHMANYKPDYGIYEVKRLVGRNFNESYIQNNLKFLPFQVKSDASGDPLVIIKQATRTLKKTPQELCTIILQKLKKDAEAKLGHTISKVVVTVPAYFNVTQREVTLAAAKQAGFTVLKLLNEPTAAALSYYFETDCEETNYSLVYDLGGGTFDVAILKRSADNIEIIGVDGDTQLGGHDFDNLLVDYVCEELITEYDYDPKTDKNNLRRLQNKCEDAKKALSAIQNTVIQLNAFVKNHPKVQIYLTREQFENIAGQLFARTIDIVNNCMINCGFSKSSIKEVILSGGSTRIPKIQKMLSDYFGGKHLNTFVNPDECVAEGAALQGAMLSENPKQAIRKMPLADVIPLSLGINTFCDEMCFLIKRNTPIPSSGLSSVTTIDDQQNSISFEVYEGERADARKNRFLGEMVLSDLTRAPPGQCEIMLSMNVDANGILTIKATEKCRNNVKELKINYIKGNQSEQEIKNALSDAKKNKEEDERLKKFIQFKVYLLKYCIRVMYNLNKKGLTDSHRNIYELCEETKAAGERMKMEKENRIKELTKDIKLKCEPIVERYNFELMPALYD